MHICVTEWRRKLTNYFQYGNVTEEHFCRHGVVRFTAEKERAMFALIGVRSQSPDHKRQRRMACDIHGPSSRPGAQSKLLVFAGRSHGP